MKIWKFFKISIVSLFWVVWGNFSPKLVRFLRAVKVLKMSIFHSTFSKNLYLQNLGIRYLDIAMWHTLLGKHSKLALGGGDESSTGPSVAGLSSWAPRAAPLWGWKSAAAPVVSLSCLGGVLALDHILCVLKTTVAHNGSASSYGNTTYGHMDYLGDETTSLK